MQTISLQRGVTARIHHSLDFVAMKKPRARGERIPAKPLKIWLENQPRGAKADFCRSLGISAAILTNWFARDLLPADRLRATALAMAVSESEYRSRAGMQVDRLSVETNVGTSIAVPKLNVRASAGNGVMQLDEEYQIGSISVPEMWVRKNIVCTSISNLRIITIFGDSMYDTLNDGDLAFVDTGVSKIDRDGVYVAEFQGELFIKRFERRPMEQEIWMHSDNKKRHPHHSVIAGEKLAMFKVLARAVFAMNGRKL